MPSKLGPHFIGTPGFERWLAAGPRVMKFDPTSLGASAQVPPGILVVGKLDQEDEQLRLTDWKALMNRGASPADAARDRFEAQRNIFVGANKPRVDRYAANGRIDVWEDDNEIVPDDPREAQWYAEYCIEMMRRYESIGKKRANFSFATGTPDIRPGHPDDIWPHLLPAIRYARDHGHYLALHEYMGPEAELGVGHTQVDVHRKRIPNAWHGRRDAAGNPDEHYPYGYCPLRYRYVYDLYLRPAGLADVPLLITECGCDGVDAVTPDDMEAGSWTHLRDGFWQRAGRDPEPHYAGMLTWYDQRLREDDFVAGAMIFTVGAGKQTKWEEWNIAGTGVEERVLAHIAAERDKADSLIPAPSAAQPAPAKPTPPAKPLTNPDLAAAKPAPEPAIAAAQPQEGVVTAPAGLNLRTTPTTAGGDETIIRRLLIGEKVTVLERFSAEWLRVRANGDTGFVFAAFVSLGVPPPPTPAPPPPRPKAGFQPGMNVNSGVHAPDVERLRGLSWVRFVFIAADRRLSVDDAFNSTYGPLIREYAAAGIRSLIILNHETEHGNVPWIHGDWAAYAPQFGRAARRVAELCAPFGDMVAFQIWNEEDSGWSADAGNPNPSARGIRPEDFAMVVDAAAANIRAVAPQAKIVAGGLKTGPHNGVAYLRAATAHLGRRLPVDAIACHPYGRYVNTDPFYGQRIGPLPEALAAYRSAFPEFPLWITEIGIPGEDNPIGPEHYDNIALYMREFVTEVANNHGNHVPVLIWFAWTDRMNNAGILTADGREKPGIFQAFLAMKARGVGSKVEALESALEGLEAVAGAEFGFVAAPAGLNLRARPIDGDVMTILLPETRLELLELADGWYRVRAGELEGFVSAEWITTVSPESQAPTPPPDARAAARPRTASVVGIHGAPGGAAPPRHLWDTWINLLREMGIRWYKQCETGDDTGEGSIFQWVLHLKRNGIEPIVRYLMNAQFPNNLEERFIRQMARYANEGVHWAEIGNEPNLAYEWQESWRGRYEGQWPHGRWAEEPRMRWGNAEAINTLARVWVEDATRAADAGAWPAFYAFGPTDWGKDRPHGHYSSTLFTELVVSRLATHHRAETIRLFRERRAWIAVHVAKYEKPLDFDPYSDDPHRPWDMSLRGYEVVLNAFRRHFGGDLNVAAIPIISTEGGVFVPDHRNSVGAERLPADDEDHARQTLDMFNFVEEKTPLTAMCPWCIAEGHAIIGHGTDLFRHHGWFKEQNGRLIERPVLAAMRRRRQELEKGIDPATLAAGGLESLAQPSATDDQPALNISLNISISLQGGEVSDVTVTVNPIAGQRGNVRKTRWIIRKSVDSTAGQEALDG